MKKHCQKVEIIGRSKSGIHPGLFSGVNSGHVWKDNLTDREGPVTRRVGWLRSRLREVT